MKQSLSSINGHADVSWSTQLREMELLPGLFLQLTLLNSIDTDTVVPKIRHKEEVLIFQPLEHDLVGMHSVLPFRVIHAGLFGHKLFNVPILHLKLALTVQFEQMQPPFVLIHCDYILLI